MKETEHIAERLRNMLQPIATHFGIKDIDRIPLHMREDAEVKAKDALKEIVDFLEDY